MRYAVRTFVTLSAVVFMLPATALAQSGTSIAGFGGVSLNAVQAQPAGLGGTVTFNLVPGLQVVGEAGRIGNVMPSLANDVFSLANTDLRASAFYGEAGVRFIFASGSAITPYAEATGGMARLNVSSSRLGPIGNAATSLALGLVGRNTPMAGVGAGILVRGGPIVLDLGYRYKRLFANDVMRFALGLGQPLASHQVRAGIGFRF